MIPPFRSNWDAFQNSEFRVTHTGKPMTYLGFRGACCRPFWGHCRSLRKLRQGEAPCAGLRSAAQACVEGSNRFLPPGLKKALSARDFADAGALLPGSSFGGDFEIITKRNLAVAKLRGSTGFRLSALRMACNSVRHAPLITGLIAYIRSVGAEKPHSLTCDCYGKNNAQGHYFCGADFGARSRFGSLANGTSRCRSPRRQRLRNDLAVAHSSLRQQSGLACSLVL